MERLISRADDHYQPTNQLFQNHLLVLTFCSSQEVLYPILLQAIKDLPCSLKDGYLVTESLCFAYNATWLRCFSE